MTSRYDDDQFDPQDTGERAAPGADPDCRYCHGTGVVHDSVDWWGATVSMPSGCECVEEQEPEPEMSGGELVEDAP